jgi:hypothetical protein
VKFAHFIFALYVAALSVYPCYDICKDESCSVTSEVRNQHDEGGDVCSPFCLSTCCGVHIISQNAFEGVSVTSDSVAEVSSYQLVFTPSIVVPIWQPPKLS